MMKANYEKQPYVKSPLALLLTQTMKKIGELQKSYFDAPADILKQLEAIGAYLKVIHEGILPYVDNQTPGLFDLPGLYFKYDELKKISESLDNVPAEHLVTPKLILFKEILITAFSSCIDDFMQNGKLNKDLLSNNTINANLNFKKNSIIFHAAKFATTNNLPQLESDFNAIKQTLLNLNLSTINFTGDIGQIVSVVLELIRIFTNPQQDGAFKISHPVFLELFVFLADCLDELPKELKHFVSFLKPETIPELISSLPKVDLSIIHQGNYTYTVKGKEERKYDIPSIYSALHTVPRQIILPSVISYCADIYEKKKAIALFLNAYIPVADVSRLILSLMIPDWIASETKNKEVMPIFLRKVLPASNTIQAEIEQEEISIEQKLLRVDTHLKACDLKINFDLKGYALIKNINEVMDKNDELKKENAILQKYLNTEFPAMELFKLGWNHDLNVTDRVSYGEVLNPLICEKKQQMKVAFQALFENEVQYVFIHMKAVDDWMEELHLVYSQELKTYQLQLDSITNALFMQNVLKEDIEYFNTRVLNLDTLQSACEKWSSSYIPTILLGISDEFLEEKLTELSKKLTIATKPFYEDIQAARQQVLNTWIKGVHYAYSEKQEAYQSQLASIINAQSPHDVSEEISTKANKLNTNTTKALEKQIEHLNANVLALDKVTRECVQWLNTCLPNILNQVRGNTLFEDALSQLAKQLSVGTAQLIECMQTEIGKLNQIIDNANKELSAALFAEKMSSANPEQMKQTIADKEREYSQLEEKIIPLKAQYKNAQEAIILTSKQIEELTTQRLEQENNILGVVSDTNLLITESKEISKKYQSTNTNSIVIETDVSDDFINWTDKEIGFLNALSGQYKEDDKRELQPYLDSLALLLTIEEMFNKSLGSQTIPFNELEALIKTSTTPNRLFILLDFTKTLTFWTKYRDEQDKWYRVAPNDNERATACKLLSTAIMEKISDAEAQKKACETRQATKQREIASDIEILSENKKLFIEYNDKKIILQNDALLIQESNDTLTKTKLQQQDDEQTQLKAIDALKKEQLVLKDTVSIINGIIVIFEGITAHGKLIQSFCEGEALFGLEESIQSITQSRDALQEKKSALRAQLDTLNSLEKNTYELKFGQIDTLLTNCDDTIKTAMQRRYEATCSKPIPGYHVEYDGLCTKYYSVLNNSKTTSAELSDLMVKYKVLSQLVETHGAILLSAKQALIQNINSMTFTSTDAFCEQEAQDAQTACADLSEKISLLGAEIAGCMTIQEQFETVYYNPIKGYQAEYDVLHEKHLHLEDDPEMTGMTLLTLLSDRDILLQQVKVLTEQEAFTVDGNATGFKSLQAFCGIKHNDVQKSLADFNNTLSLLSDKIDDSALMWHIGERTIHVKSEGDKALIFTPDVAYPEMEEQHLLNATLLQEVNATLRDEFGDFELQVKNLDNSEALQEKINRYNDARREAFDTLETSLITNDALALRIADRKSLLVEPQLIKLTNYLEERNQQFYFKNKDMRRVFIQELQTRLQAYAKSGESAEVFEHIRIHRKQLTGGKLEQILNQLTAKIMDSDYKIPNNYVVSEQEAMSLDAQATNVLLQFVDNPDYYQRIIGLHNQVKAMRDFGNTLAQDDPCHTIAVELADKLDEDIHRFVIEHPEHAPGAVAYEQFQDKFTARAHSQDEYMQPYWPTWAVILANIAIGVASLGSLLAIKAIASYVKTGESFLFFRQTDLQEKVGEINKLAKEILLAPPVA